VALKRLFYYRSALLSYSSSSSSFSVSNLLSIASSGSSASYPSSSQNRFSVPSRALGCISLRKSKIGFLNPKESKRIQKLILRFLTEQINTRTLGSWCVKGIEESTPSDNTGFEGFLNQLCWDLIPCSIDPLEHHLFAGCPFLSSRHVSKLAVQHPSFILHTNFYFKWLIPALIQGLQNWS